VRIIIQIRDTSHRNILVPKKEDPMRLSFAALVLALACVKSSRADEPKDAPRAERFRLDNGLTVLVRPVEGAENVAVLMLYNVGGDHDPQGRSGLAHLVEHVYVTAAAGKAPARTVDEFTKKYPGGWNAQTGDRFTVISTVVPKDDLDKELRDAAARMSDLRVTAADLEREKPRILNEVANMFGRIPNLGALNNARELLRPTPRDGRKGGVPEHVKAATLKEVQQHWERYYKPRNAVLVVAGAVDLKTAREAITTHFAKLPRGEEPPAPAEPGKAKYGTVRELAVESLVPDAGAEICLAYAAPKPDSELYAPYLVLVARLWAGGAKLGAGPQRFPVYVPLLDDPAVLCVTAPAKKGETAKEATARLETFVAEAVEPKLRKDEAATARQAFALFLGTADLSDAQMARNLYGVAFALGRREQLGIDPAKLKKALENVTDEDLRRAAKEIFATDRHTAAFVTAREK
jgi:zinc protease